MNNLALIFYILFALTLIMAVIYIDIRLAKLLNIKKKRKKVRRSEKTTTKL